MGCTSIEKGISQGVKDQKSTSSDGCISSCSGVSTSATTSGADTPNSIYPTLGKAVLKGLLSSVISSMLFLSPYQTFAPNGPSGPNGSVVEVEKLVVSVRIVMIESTHGVQAGDTDSK
ncbi:hypothetical protein Dimus_005379 [Dionaea muscipula]